MQAQIYYFSATGNTLALSKNIAAAIGGQLVSIAGLTPNGAVVPESDTVGIVFPSYFAQHFGVPEVVARFIGRFDFSAVKYLFVICTYGGYGLVNAYPTLKTAMRLIQARGGSVDLQYGMRMPLSNLDYDHIPVPLERDSGRILASAEIRAGGIIQNIAARRGRGRFSINLLYYLFAPMYALLKGSIFRSLRERAHEGESTTLDFHQLIPLTDKSIAFDGSKCTSCAVCERVCPVGNIELRGGKPVWLHRCEMCFACDEWCSFGAIQHWSRKNGVKYRYPGTKYSDIGTKG